MSHHRLTLSLSLTLVLACAASSWGQGVPRYQPARPTVSPYLNLFRNNTGPLPNYYSLVRPQLYQQEFNQQQLAFQAQQAANMNSLQTQMLQSSAATPTGKGSGFMTSGKYFMRPYGTRR